MQANCLVRTLKIRTGDQERLPRITFLIEDALRTASFPGLPPNGVVYIKSMDLGRFDDRTSSGLLSRRIDASIRNLRPIRMSGRSPDHADIPAVWFASELEPHRLLSERLIRGALPRAWFWPVAVEGWSVRHPVAQNFQEIISQVVQKSAGLAQPSVLANLVYVLEPLFENDIILHLLQSLPEKPIRGLVASLGLSAKRMIMSGAGGGGEPSAHVRSEKPTYAFDDLDPRCRALIVKAVHRWGAAGARATLMTALVLADKNEALNSNMIQQAMIEVVARKERRRNHPLENPSSEKDLPDRTRVWKPPPPAEETQPIPAVGVKAFLNGASERSNTRAEPDDDTRRFPEPPRKYLQTDESSVPPISREDTDPSGKPGATRPPSRPHQKKPRGLDGHTQPASRNHNTGPEQMGLDHPFAGEYTRFAGFPLLINVLARLGIEGIFADYPEYPVNALRETILWRIAFWQKIPRDDPAVQFLRAPERVFRQATKAHIALTRQAIFTKARPAVQDLFRIPRSRDPSRLLSLRQMTAIFIIAVCRAIRRQSRVTIRKLIRRPAFVALTRSHLDITASLATLDIRIRLAGLDVNPGWVPWLQRIIQIHYTEDDQ